MRSLKVVPVMNALVLTLYLATPAWASGEQVNLVVNRSNDEYTYSKITFEYGDLAVIVVKGSVNPWGWPFISNYYPPTLGAKKNHVRTLYHGCLVAKHDGGAVNAGNFLAATNITGQLRFKFQGAKLSVLTLFDGIGRNPDHARRGLKAKTPQKT